MSTATGSPSTCRKAIRRVREPTRAYSLFAAEASVMSTPKTQQGILSAAVSMTDGPRCRTSSKSTIRSDRIRTARPPSSFDSPGDPTAGILRLPCRRRLAAASCECRPADSSCSIRLRSMHLQNAEADRHWASDLRPSLPACLSFLIVSTAISLTTSARRSWRIWRRDPVLALRCVRFRLATQDRHELKTGSAW